VDVARGIESQRGRRGGQGGHDQQTVARDIQLGDESSAVGIL
jgi:hypothetical protein